MSNLKQTPFGVVDRAAFYEAAMKFSEESGYYYSCAALFQECGPDDLRGNSVDFYRHMFSPIPPEGRPSVYFMEEGWWNSRYSTPENQLARSIALLLAYEMLEDYPDA